MIKDRGNIKWSSLMLSEHRKKLEKLYEMDKSLKKPVIDEQELEKMDKVLKQAIHEKVPVRIRYYHMNALKEYYGIIEKYNILAREIILESKEGKYKIEVENIIKLSF
ncbi:MAG: YolD-like family protein [bacterium]